MGSRFLPLVEPILRIITDRPGHLSGLFGLGLSISCKRTHLISIGVARSLCHNEEGPCGPGLSAQSSWWSGAASWRRLHFAGASLPFHRKAAFRYGGVPVAQTGIG